MRHPRTSIAAKIARPSLTGVFPRPRLFRVLDRRRGHPIVWVSGPPGSGKTTLVASYLDSHRLPCLWYQVDEGDSDVATFFYYMGLAVGQAAPTKRPPLPLLTPEYLPGLSVFTKRYFEQLYARMVPPFIIVLDNYQDVSIHCQFHDVVRNGLSVLPEGVRAVLISRSEPPAQFTAFRAKRRMAFIGWDEVRFALPETRTFLRIRGHTGFPRKLILQLQDNTAGWAAGLVLLTERSETGGLTPPRLGPMPTQEIFDYFALEVFEKADNPTQTFLLKTAFLPQITPAMAQRLTGIAQASAILSALHRNNFFTTKRVVHEDTFQYHPLFRQFLLSRAHEILPHGEISLLKRTAASALQESGRFEDAAALFIDAAEWKGLTSLILSYAESLVSQGRSGALQAWIESIPDDILQHTAWLLYWLGICRQAFDPPGSRECFQKAFTQMDASGDEAGTLLSWSAAVDTILAEWSNFAELDSWIGWLDNRLGPRSPFSSPRIEACVVSSMAGALLTRMPFHPDTRTWIERAYVLSQKSTDINVRILCCFHALHYYFWIGDVSRSGIVHQEIQKIVRSPFASPLHAIRGRVGEALTYTWSTTRLEQALASVSEGLRTARENDVHLWDPILIANGIYAALTKGEIQRASDLLQAMEPSPENRQRHAVAQYHALAAWRDLLAGSAVSALGHMGTALDIAIETGMVFPEILYRIAMAQVLHENAEYKKAFAQLISAEQLARRSKSEMLLYMSLLGKAQFLLEERKGKRPLRDRDTGEEPLEPLRKALAIGRKHGYINTLWGWRADVMTDICTLALEQGIEVEYVQHLISTRNLLPPAETAGLEKWPFPLRIYALGRFEILRWGKAVVFSGRVQKKPLEMLKALLAFGGRDVPEEQLSDAIWPDAEGDLAHISFKTTLSRLRRLLGIENAVTVVEGRVTLDARYCWVDAWTFEQLCGYLEQRWKPALSSEDTEKTLQRAKMAVDLYKGHFLAGAAEHLASASFRERLREMYQRLLLRAGTNMEQRGQWRVAGEYYQKGIDSDDLAEEFYQRLMTCYLHLDKRAEAIRIYKRCKDRLSAILGIEPSPKTEAIYQKLLS